MNYLFCLAAVVIVCLGLAAVFASGVADAQEPERFVDLSVELEVNEDSGTEEPEFLLQVSNLGNQAAYDVIVTAESPFGRGGWSLKLSPPVGTVNFSHGANIAGNTFRWEIPVIPAHGHYVAEFDKTAKDTAGLRNTIHGYTANGSIGSYEHPDRLHNNSARAYMVIDALNDNWSAEPDYSVQVSSLSTRANSADFTVTVVLPDDDGPAAAIRSPCVNVRLTSGLTAGTPTFDPPNDPNLADTLQRSFDTSSTKQCGGTGDATGVIDLPDHHGELMASMTLPVTVNSGATLSEQCLTAEIFALPPTGGGRSHDDPSDNVARACLGAPPDEPAVFSSGHSDLFTWYDCSEATSHPCDDSVSLELVALGGTAEVGLPYGIFDPDNVVVHVPDPAGRATSSDSKSDALVWSTGFEEPGTGHGHGGDRAGIIMGTNQTFLDLETTADPDLWGTPNTGAPLWEQGEVSVALSGPGTMSSWYHDTTNNVSAAWSYWGGALKDGGTYSTTERWLGSTTDLGYRGDLWSEFSALGTYEFTMTIAAPYDDDTTDATPGTKYSSKGTYTFHVGPMAELLVRDGGSSPDVATDQYAIRVAALNNGPDDTLGAEVTIDLTALPAGVTVNDHMISDGDGNYSAGTWDLGTLETADYRRGVGKPEAATLTLILAGDDAANATATATISHDNTNHPYTVCIDSDGNTLAHTSQTDCAGDAATTNVWYSAVCVNTADGEIDSTITVEATCDGTTDRAWTENVCASSDGSVRAGRTETECGGWFQGTVYDYKDGNDTDIPLTAHAGTAGGGEGAPTVQSANDPGSSITVTWEAVDTVNGVLVTHYEVQRLQNPWVTLHSEVEGTEYIDTNVGPGQTHQYRVRAVNGAGVPGPWSMPMQGTTASIGGGGTVTVEVPVYVRPEGPTGLEAEADGETKVVIDWDTLSLLYDAPVDYYEVEASEDGKYWMTLAPSLTQTTYTHQGLEAGATHYYRVYAHSEEGRSLASAVACGSTDGALGKPCMLDVEVAGATVTLSWINATGADGHLAVLANAVDYSLHGGLAELPAGTTSYTFQDVPSGRYVALVLAYTGALEDLDYRYDSALITVE